MIAKEARAIGVKLFAWGEKAGASEPLRFVYRRIKSITGARIPPEVRKMVVMFEPVVMTDLGALEWFWPMKGHCDKDSGVDSMNATSLGKGEPLTPTALNALWL
jgi:hypothetical protein